MGACPGQARTVVRVAVDPLEVGAVEGDDAAEVLVGGVVPAGPARRDVHRLRRPAGVGVREVLAWQQVDVVQDEGVVALRVGFGRIVVSEIEVPNLLANLV